MIEPSYIIVQAGGRGSRMGHLTDNKPKALVPINNLPMLFHLFRKYLNKKFVIVGDYKKDVLDKYLDAFADVEFLTVGPGVCGSKGTCAGIASALKCIPLNEPFALVWSDLILGESFTLPSGEENCVGLSGDFRCRWRYHGGKFEEIPSEEEGVAGFFVFRNKAEISDVPDSGEFVRWLEEKNLKFTTTTLGGTAEFGLEERVVAPEEGRCRPFNSMRLEGNRLVKEPIDDQGRKLAIREKAWYKHVEGSDIAIPHIYSYDPLIMEKIDGRNVYSYELSEGERRIVLEKLMAALEKMHRYDHVPSDKFSIFQAYYQKTVDRLNKVRDLIPFADRETITVNGRVCRNAFYHFEKIRERVMSMTCDGFCLIHGDCTFSNILLSRGEEPVFIDPRGYFGKSEIVGDPLYDWSKLYYSVMGDYDQFNLGRFKLTISDDGVILDIRSNGWKDMDKEFEKLLPKNIDMSDVRFVHALIWLSLTTYAWNDYDSVCGAFYNGIYYLEEVL